MTRSPRLFGPAIGGLLAAGILAGCGGQSNGTAGGVSGPSQLASSPSGGAPTGGTHDAASSPSSQAQKASTGDSSNKSAGPGGSSNKSVNPGGSSKDPGGTKSSDNGGIGGRPTPDGPETNNQANFGVAFSCQTGPDPRPDPTAQFDCGQNEQFGVVALGRTHTVALTLKSFDPENPVTIANATIEGDNAHQYNLDPGTCTPGAQVAGASSDASVTSPAQTCTLRVTFTPTSEGIQRATLVIATDKQERAMTITLRGTGTASGSAAASPGG